MTVLEYFNSTHGARKGLADTALKTANSGYLTRRLVDVAQDCIVTIDDCFTEKYLTVRAEVEGGEVIDALSEKILGRTIAEDIIDPKSKKTIISRGDIIDEEHIPIIESLNIEEVKIRSVLSCEADFGVCVKCYGRDLARGTPVNIGEAVGVIAAQSIGEPGTQLTMRTFHIGGAAQKGSEISNVESNVSGTIKFNNVQVSLDSNGNNINLSRSAQLCIFQGDKEKAKHRVPLGSKINVKENQKIDKGVILAEWDPFTIPIIGQISGYVIFKDLDDGVSTREVIDESTGLASKMVVDWKQQAKNQSLNPRIEIHDKLKSGNILTLENGSPASYEIPVDAILGINSGDKIKRGDFIARVPKESSKTKDITGGLPRVAELFEARKPKDHAIIAEISGKIEFGKDYKMKRKILIRSDDKSLEPVEYVISKSKHLSVQEGDYVEIGDVLVDGSSVPHDILRIKGVEALSAYMIKEVQDVYRLQGVKINDKHIEVVVKQMMQKVEIIDGGETTLLVGEQISKKELDETNKKAKSENLKEAKASPILLGITKASLQTDSFISAASFQETTRVLTEASVSGKIDSLVGLKENVIVGRLVPCGTGSFLAQAKIEAAKRDKELLDVANETNANSTEPAQK